MGLTLTLGIRTGSEAGVRSRVGQSLWMHTGLFPGLFQLQWAPYQEQIVQMFSTSAETLLYYLDEIFFGLVLAYNNVYIYF